MKKIYFVIIILFYSFPGITGVITKEQNVLKLTLNEAIQLAQLQSVEAAVTINELKTSYWLYRTHLADQLPEINFNGYVPAYNKKYDKYMNEVGVYSYVRTNTLGVSGEFSVDQNVPLTGGTVSLITSLDFTRQLSIGAGNEYMSIPVGITLEQPILGVNKHKWERKIEPVRYQEAKANYIESVELVTIYTIQYFFNLLLAEVRLATAEQNLENAEKLYEIAIAKRKIGHISESELMQLNLSAIQAKGTLTNMQSNLNAAIFQLKAFLGLDEDIILEPVIPPTVPSVHLSYDEVLNKAQQNNSLAKKILRTELEAEYEVATAKGNQREISLFASIGYTGKDKLFRDAYNNLVSNQIVEVGFRIPLLDWGKRKGKVKVSESNREVALAKIRKEELEFYQDIFLLVERFNNQSQQLNIAVKADEIAEKRYYTSIETFMIGKINILDLNDAQNAKDQARENHINELYNYWYYFYKVRNVTLYDFVRNATIDADIEDIIKR